MCLSPKKLLPCLKGWNGGGGATSQVFVIIVDEGKETRKPLQSNEMHLR